MFLFNNIKKVGLGSYIRNRCVGFCHGKKGERKKKTMRENMKNLRKPDQAGKKHNSLSQSPKKYQIVCTASVMQVFFMFLNPPWTFTAFCTFQPFGPHCGWVFFSPYGMFSFLSNAQCALHSYHFVNSMKCMLKQLKADWWIERIQTFLPIFNILHNIFH